MLNHTIFIYNKKNVWYNYYECRGEYRMIGRIINSIKSKIYNRILNHQNKIISVSKKNNVREVDKSKKLTEIEKYNLYKKELSDKLTIKYQEYLKLKDEYDKLVKTNASKSELDASYTNLTNVIKEYNMLYNDLKEVKKNIVCYEVLSPLGTTIDTIKTEEGLLSFTNDIKKKRKEFIREYNSKLEKYNDYIGNSSNKEKMKEELLQIYDRYTTLDEISKEIDNIIKRDKEEKIKKEENKDVSENAIREKEKSTISDNDNKENKVTYEKDEKDFKTSKNSPKLLDSSDREVIAIIAASKDISKLKEKYFNLEDKKSESARLVAKEIYRMCEIRERFITSKCGNDGTNLIVKLESLEDEKCNMPNVEKAEDYVLTTREEKTEFLNNFNNIVSIVSDIEFNKEDSEYYKRAKTIANNKNKELSFRDFKERMLRSYENVVCSVFGDKKDKISESRDLISMFSLFNEKGGYKEFRSKHEGGMLGGERISEKVYKERLQVMKSMKDDMLASIAATINSTDKIVIEDKHETKKDKEKELNDKVIELCNMLTTKKKENSIKR